jgi:hypothetical protein
MEPRRKHTIDLSKLSLEELKALISAAEQVLATRRFEEGLSHALNEYRSRDPRVIRF